MCADPSSDPAGDTPDPRSCRTRPLPPARSARTCRAPRLSYRQPGMQKDKPSEDSKR